MVFAKYEGFSQAHGLERNKGKREKTWLSLRVFLYLEILQLALIILSLNCIKVAEVSRRC